MMNYKYFFIYKWLLGGIFLTNILITGATGFVGSHMVDYLISNHPESKIYITKRWMEDTKNLDHIGHNKF